MTTAAARCGNSTIRVSSASVETRGAGSRGSAARTAVDDRRPRRRAGPRTSRSAAGRQLRQRHVEERRRGLVERRRTWRRGRRRPGPCRRRGTGTCGRARRHPARGSAPASRYTTTRGGAVDVRAGDRAAPQERQPQDLEVALVDAGVVRLRVAVPNAISSIELPNIRGRRLVKATARDAWRRRDAARAPPRRTPCSPRRRSPRIPARTAWWRCRRGRSPGSMRAPRSTARTKRPAATSSTSDSASCPATRTRPRRERRRPASRRLGLQPIGDVAAGALQRRHQPEHQAGRERRGDGERQHAQVGGDLERDRTDAGSGSRSSAAVAAVATTKPPSAPSPNSASTSVRSCRTRRRRPAPSAARTARSRPRAA